MTPIMWWGLIANDFLAKPTKLASRWRYNFSLVPELQMFDYFVWSKAKRSTVWEHFEQGADIQNGSPKALCKACWKVFAHPELRIGGSSTSTLRRHTEHKKCGGSKTRQELISQFGAVVSD